MARSSDGLLDRFFLLPPQAAAQPGERRSALVPPTYFCTRSIFELAHTFVSALKLQVPDAPRPALPFPAIPARGTGDAVRHVHHQFAFAEFQETVDDFGQPPPGGTLEFGAVKQFGAADQHDCLGHQRETALHASQRKVQPSLLCQLGGGEDFGQAAGFRLSLTNDEHLLADGQLVHFIADPADVAAEPFHRLHPQVTSRFHRAGRDARQGDRRKLHCPAENLLDRVALLGPL